MSRDLDAQRRSAVTCQWFIDHHILSLSIGGPAHASTARWAHRVTVRLEPVDLPVIMAATNLKPVLAARPPCNVVAASALPVSRTLRAVLATAAPLSS